MNTTLTGPYPRIIGIHVTLPQGTQWPILGVESTMLQRLIHGALIRATLYQGEFKGVRQSAAFAGQFFAMVPVTDFGAALRCVAEELSALKLLEGAQLAWLDRQEGVWRNERPLPERVSFARRIADFAIYTTAHANAVFGSTSEFAATIRQQADTLGKITALQQPSPIDGL